MLFIPMDHPFSPSNSFLCIVLRSQYNKPLLNYILKKLLRHGISRNGRWRIGEREGGMVRQVMGGIDKGFRAILDIGWANPKAVEDKSYANPIKGKGIFSTFFFLLRRGANAAQLTCSTHMLVCTCSLRFSLCQGLNDITHDLRAMDACMHALLCGYFKILSCMYTCKAVNGL